MAEIQINTTQNVKISFTAADLGLRMVAFIIDGVIKIAYLWVVWAIIEALPFNETYEGMDPWSQRAVQVVVGFPTMIYTLVLESLLEGQTLGKKLVKIRVVKIDGFQASFSDYVIRWFFRIVDIWLFFLPGVIAIATSKRNQRIGDMASGTAVITLKDKVKFSQTILEHLKEGYQPTYPSVIKLSDNDARIIKETFVTAKRNVDHATLIKLRDKIEEVIGVKSKHKDTFGFIDTVLKDYNFYTQDM
ncbi:RDD family protein [Sungkyunkwania multivorans]|uniref:RDD family protein n=1 Tax=Sungkyunkwania multivorans TaxID=1173618 RepID=A0ABW3CVZ3_9FLAO